MTFVRPTLKTLIERGQDDLNARLPGADSRLRRSTLGVLVTVVMGGVNGLYGYLDHLARQLLPDTAEGRWLERHASIRALARKGATQATGPVTVTGTPGAIVPAGARLQAAGRIEYVVQARVVLAGVSATVTVAAAKPGVAASVPAGTRLTFVSPIAGIAASALVAAGGLVGGADEESDVRLRDRLLARIRQPPAGGAIHDYPDWALQVAEVTRVWVYPGWMGAGTVGVAFVMDGRPDPIPLPADVARVQAAIDPVKPVTAEAIVFAPIPVPLDLTIDALVPGDAATRAAVTEELRDLLVREAQPGGTILLSRLREAISQAAGEMDHVLVSPVANVAHGPGELATLGEITWA